MPIRIIIDGRVVECESPRDAAELLRLLGPASGSTEADHGTARPRRRESTTQLVISLLTRVRKAGPQGIMSHDLAQRLGLRGTRGLGSLIGAVKRELNEVGQQFEEIVVFERSRQGTRWFSTRKTLGAIEALQASIADPSPGDVAPDDGNDDGGDGEGEVVSESPTKKAPDRENFPF